MLSYTLPIFLLPGSDTSFFLLHFVLIYKEDQFLHGTQRVGRKAGAQRYNVPCLKSLIRLGMGEEFNSSECLTSASQDQDQEDPEEDYPVGCFAVAQCYVHELCLLAQI